MPCKNFKKQKNSEMSQNPSNNCIIMNMQLYESHLLGRPVHFRPNL